MSATVRRSAWEELRVLLAERFTPAELYAWLWGRYEELRAYLPTPGGAVPAVYAFAVLQRLEGDGLVNDEFFAALAEQRPRLVAEVRAVQRRWNGEEVAAASSGASPQQPPRYEGPRGAGVAALRDFTGRARPLAELKRLLQAHATVCVVASGIGGVGKTTLVQEFVARRGAACFPDGSAWLDGQALVGELARVARRFGWNEVREPTPAEAKELLRRVLEGRKFLVVVDDVGLDDVAMVPVPGGSCRTLVTSRSTTLHLDLENAVPLPLELWSIKECQKFLDTKGLRRAQDTVEELRALAEFVGRLPLGVRLIARMLCNRPGSSAKVILAELRRQPVGALERHRGHYPGLVATFQATWEALPSASRRVLSTLAACANETRTDIVAAVSGVADAGAVLDDLTVRSLVQCSPASGTPWSLHDVVRMFVADQPGFAELAAAHLAWVMAHMEAHADPLQHAEFATGAAEATHALLRCIKVGDVEQAVSVYDPLRSHLLQIGQLSYVIVVAQALFEICPEGSWNASMCIVDLGRCCISLGKLQEAIGYFERSLAIGLKLGRLDGQAECLCNLGICYWMLGERPRAIEHHELSLAIEVKLGRLEGQADDLCNLGGLLLDAGEMPGAIEYIGRSLAINERLGRLEGQAKALGNLGLCYRELGEIPRAIEYHEQSLAIDEKLGRTEGLANQLCNLGICHESVGDMAKARHLLCRSLELYRRMGLSDEHPDVHAVLEALARLE